MMIGRGVKGGDPLGPRNSPLSQTSPGGDVAHPVCKRGAMRLQPILPDAVTGGALAEFIVDCRAFRHHQISPIARKYLSRIGHGE
jgi:hypothetical protein